ncbi:carboxymuconolactone decarboxylase family protein [Halomonas cerina]|uniref:Putative peroxidase-related enzyme n=1 Tax=Halomonas cerina TaxID=447424 RepID=A0A839V1D4_9GAMM|nr:carboxymuconolactone decarboxylase family protein [Halomonas cerina]MBB3189553.1 putative peroxidase-related enzyme [Halomonas cerina]
MSQFPLHDIASAPEDAKARLEGAQQKMGFIPHVFGKMAEAPALLEAYMTLDEIYSRTSLTPAQQQTALVAVSVDNRCEFCVAAHTGGLQQADVSQGDINRLREQSAPEDPKLAAVARFARHLNATRGWAEQSEIQAFLDAGFEQRQILELVIACALKTLSNYTNHIAETPLNEELKPLAWQAAP